MHVIFMCPHFPASQRKFAAGLKSVGAMVTGIGDLHPDYLDSHLREILDGYEYVPFIGDEDAVFNAVRRIQDRGPWVHRFEATIESHMGVVARVRERTGIPGLSWEVVERCRDKFKMKNFLRDNGVSCARNAAIDNAEDARAFAKQVGYPLILKPRDGAGAAGTHKVDNDAQLEAALHEEGLDRMDRFFTMEEFITGHEGFYDTITAGGRVLFDGISHYYPNVLQAMRNREENAMIVCTNRMDSPGYTELYKMGRKVISLMGVDNSATHMEWFYGPKGLHFSEIGARPPGVNYFEIHAAANEIDIFVEWARAVCWQAIDHPPTHRYAAGILNIRPNRDGIVRGHVGVGEMQAKYGPYIFAAHLPHPGKPTQPIEAGYLANGWIMARHPDYDGLREMFDDIGRNLHIIAG